MDNTTVAVLVTCFNRKQHTLKCLDSLFSAVDTFNEKTSKILSVEVYLTDDGCTDGTAEAVIEQYQGRLIHILRGSGNLYWAGGMRLAWNAAINSNVSWDYYLLINDDTFMASSLFEDLFNTDAYCQEKYSKQGIYSGFISEMNSDRVSFGGSSTTKGLLRPNGAPQECDRVCANVLMVPSSVVTQIGVLDKDYVHSGADYDYAIKCKKSRIPVLTTYDFVASCENEHRKSTVYYSDMTYLQRKKQINSPVSGRKDYYTFLRKHYWYKLPFSMLIGLYQLYLPHFYDMIFTKRDIRNAKRLRK